MTSTRSLGEKIDRMLAAADVRLNGGRPWDIIVRDDRLYARVISQGALGVGEAYTDGWWDCVELSQMFCKVLKAHLDRAFSMNWSWVLAYLRAKISNQQGESRAVQNVHSHYDLGNELYRNMLGRWMLYSSANWEHAATLDEAGEAKLDFACRRLRLRPGMKLLDIGCGWGGFARYAAKVYGVHVVGITLSKEQADLAKQLCGDLPVEIRLQDYRHLDEKYDRVVSLGMFEHVGYKNYRQYMEIVHRCLQADGLFFLNTIGANQSGCCLNPWMDKYIFPGAVLPSIAQIGAAIDGLFVIEELQDWADFYDKTLLAWFANFQANWHKLNRNYTDRFYRMWKYYLLSCAGAFRAKSIQDWQILLSS